MGGGDFREDKSDEDPSVLLLSPEQDQCCVFKRLHSVDSMRCFVHVGKPKANCCFGFTVTRRLDEGEGI